MKVLFIRHGKAEALQTGILDSERHLTQEALKELQEKMPYLRAYLSNASTKVFSSPLIRAVETARYVSQEITEIKFLKTGNRDDLLKCINEHQTYDYLLFVGHEPYISQWVHELCQKEIDVKTGMLIECEYPFKFIRALKLKDYSHL